MDGEDDDYEEEKITAFEDVVDNALNCVGVVDGLPVVPAEKFEKLKKHLSSAPALLAKWGSKPKQVTMPLKAEKTQGFAFLEFESPEAARAAMKAADGHKLDKKHVLKCSLMCDFERIVNTKSDYIEPKMEGYKPAPNAFNWLMDEQARDQYVLRFAEETQVYWNDAHRGPEKIKDQTRWADTYVRWSPKGRYLTTFHHQGILLWGGKGWDKLKKFGHANVVDLLYSPNESYLITWSVQRGAVVWDVRTGAKLREFKDMVNMDKYGQFRWSPDEKMVARISKTKSGEAISIYNLESQPPMQLLEDSTGKKAPILASGVADLQWSPTDPILTYWIPEKENDPASVIVMKLPERKVIAQKNLFLVVDMQIHWQETGDFLCVRVDRTNKTKKQKLYNFELFRMREKDIPAEQIKMDVPIVSFAWEPVGSRFGVVYGESSRPDITFYDMAGQDSGGNAMVVKVGETLENKSANRLFWAPQGQFCVLAGLQSGALNGTLEFWDINSMENMGINDHLMCTGISWDPTGRYVCSYVSMADQSTAVGMENGFNIYTLQGVPLYTMQLEKFYQFLWRPRPASPLDDATKKKIKKNLHEIGKKLDSDDAILKNALSGEEKERLDKLKGDWARYTEDWAKSRAKEKVKRTAAQGFDSDEEDDPSDYEITFEDVEELVESFVTVMDD